MGLLYLLLSALTKIYPCVRHEGVLGSGGNAPCICNLHTRSASLSGSFTPTERLSVRSRAALDDLAKTAYPSAIQTDYVSLPVHSATSYTKLSRLFNFSIEYSRTFLILLRHDLCKSSTNSIIIFIKVVKHNLVLYSHIGLITVSKYTTVCPI